MHKPVIKKFNWRKVYARFKENIRAADLAEMGSLSSFNYRVPYFLWNIGVFAKYAWVKPLKDKNYETNFDVFVGIVNKSKRKLKKIPDRSRKRIL